MACVESTWMTKKKQDVTPGGQADSARHSTGTLAGTTSVRPTCTTNGCVGSFRDLERRLAETTMQRLRRRTNIVERYIGRYALHRNVKDIISRKKQLDISQKNREKNPLSWHGRPTRVKRNRSLSVINSSLPHKNQSKWTRSDRDN